MKTILSNILSTLEFIISDENRLNKIQSYILNLQQLHESRDQYLNLHIFLNDLLIIIRRFLTNIEIYRWQSAIDGCIIRQYPWFKSSSLLSSSSSNNKILNNHSLLTNNNYFQPPPSIDHTYTFNNEYNLNDKKMNLLLNYLDKNQINNEYYFNNFHHIDKRKCQICETLSDHILTNIGRLISFGINQWVHVGCILPAYAKNLDQPPYILRNIRETVQRCQTKYICGICSKLGASVHCNENECYQRFHCDCIQKYYLTIDKNLQEQLNIKNGYLPNLTTLCLKHNGLKTINNNNIHRDSIDGINEDNETKELSNTNGINIPKIKSVNTLSTVYGDLSNNLVEFSLINTHLCIGSLQIESLGNFDYQIDKNDENIFSNKIYPNNYRASRVFWSIKNPQQKTIYHLNINIEQTYHNEELNHKIIKHPMTNKQIYIEQIYDLCRKYFEKFQKKIDQHSNYIEEFCQKTLINKKNLQNQTNYKKRTTNTGNGLTKRLTKETPSCVKRQTPKAALKNISRPRNRFANDKQSQILLTTKQNLSQDNLILTKDYKTNEIQNLFHEEFLKSPNVSHFALALVQALRHVGQSTKIQQQQQQQQQSNLNYNLLNSSNGITTEKNNDLLLKQLLKNITVPQQLNDSQISAMNSSQLSSFTSQWRSSISTQTETLQLSKSYDDSQHSYSSFNGAIPLVHTTDNTSNLLSKSTRIPQVDGSIDDDNNNNNDDDFHISSIVLNSLIEQIIDKTNSECFHTNSEYSIDLSDYVNSPSFIDFTPISPTNHSHQIENSEKNKSISSYDLIELYKQWLKLNFSRVKFTITNDEGYKIISDDLDSAWSTIINLIRNCRDDMNLQHLSMTNEELNGHKIFGLTKPIIQIMLNQMYTNQQQIGTIILPLSSSSSSSLSNNISNNNNNNSSCSIENFNKKKLLSSCSRSNIYERKTRERQRFGWLLNQSRKIEYALKSFEIDNALIYARRIILEEASVSLRLYHLHYFSERALLVGSSPIHGCGLFTLVDLIEGQMIIEYTGEVVRPCLTDKRERENEGKGFGCYMFTVDSMNVIDATHRGNKARFINHNCEPNCFAKTVLSGGIKHIVIYALMDISRGSELTYDYSFPEEDVKIPCHCGTIIFTIIVQSVPIEKTKGIVQSYLLKKNKDITNQQHHHHQFIQSVETTTSSTSSTTNPTITVSQSSSSTSTITPIITDKKKKRYIDDGLDEFLDNELDSSQLPYLKYNNGHKLHAKVQETIAKIHDNADKPVDTDDSKVFSDITMTPSELTDIVRRRRDVKLNTRRKRAISPYNFYDTDSFYDPYADLIEGYQYARPTRSFAPLYWYPSDYQRNIRSALAPSFYESSVYPTLYSTIVDNDENPIPTFDDEIEDNNEYESDSYPILLELSNNPLDNVELSEQYDREDDLPIDESTEEMSNENDNDDNDDDDDDDDEAQYRLIYPRQRSYYTRYGPLETYY
ncbi:unnamed protein product [Rotaria sordida]|uniref:SET domain-containing protein n=1 Tax=Rotaria sordida TaxID=392033 RepID=A0A818Z2K7_9BILA|nr:unnamed protein product [Rotaria sordida]